MSSGEIATSWLAWTYPRPPNSTSPSAPLFAAKKPAWVDASGDAPRHPPPGRKVVP
jgi:hypothetical protein